MRLSLTTTYRGVAGLDGKRAERVANTAFGLGISAVVLTGIGLLLCKVLLGVLPVSFMVLWMRLSAKEVGRRRGVAIAGFGIPAAIASIAWLVIVGAALKSDAPAGNGGLAALILALIVAVPAGLLIAATVLASKAPSGTRPPEGAPSDFVFAPGREVFVLWSDGREYRARISALGVGQAYVEFQPGGGGWIPNRAMRVVPVGV